METKQEHYESMMQAITRYAPSTDLEVIQRAYTPMKSIKTNSENPESLISSIRLP